MKRDYYLYRKNRKSRTPITILVNSLEDDGDNIIFYRGMIGSLDYECGRNEYSVRSSDYEYRKVGVGCYPETDVYQLSERVDRVIEYWNKKSNLDVEPIIS